MIFKTEADTAFEILQHFAKKSAETMANIFCRKFRNIFYFGKNAEEDPAEHGPCRKWILLKVDPTKRRPC